MRSAWRRLGWNGKAGSMMANTLAYVMSTRCCGGIFFFSSRRRHTRCGRDWSSDVCSSDLTCSPSRVTYFASAVELAALGKYVTRDGLHVPYRAIMTSGRKHAGKHAERLPLIVFLHGAWQDGNDRSEERRVGKEWRSRRRRY